MNKHTITVCDKCFQASCWQGLFMCEDSQNAGTVEKAIYELRELNTGEHESYWKNFNPETGEFDLTPLAGIGIKLYLVMFSQLRQPAIDSIWFSKEKAENRVDILNKKHIYSTHYVSELVTEDML